MPVFIAPSDSNVMLVHAVRSSVILRIIPEWFCYFCSFHFFIVSFTISTLQIVSIFSWYSFLVNWFKNDISGTDTKLKRLKPHYRANSFHANLAEPGTLDTPWVRYITILSHWLYSASNTHSLSFLAHASTKIWNRELRHNIGILFFQKLKPSLALSVAYCFSSGAKRKMSAFKLSTSFLIAREEHE